MLMKIDFDTIHLKNWSKLGVDILLYQLKYSLTVDALKKHDHSLRCASSGI